MKKNIFYFGIIVLSLILFTACSSDDDNSNTLNENAEKLLGTWGGQWDDGTGISVHPKFTFESNGNVKYYTYSGTEPELEEIGTWNMDEDILTTEFPETVLLKFKNKIVFISDTKINFVEVNETGFDTWSAGTYYKTNDPNL